MIKVLIADDHTLVREGIKQILSETRNISVEGEAKDGHEVLERIRENHYDVLLLDMAMPGRNGLDILEDIKRTHPDIAVLVLSMYPEEQYAFRVLKLGASGYMTKETASLELIAAIEKVAGGGKYITSSIAEKLAFNLEKDTSLKPHERLSNREFQTLCLIGAGKTVSDIAVELSLSVKTISTYRERILDKMEMKSNSELMFYVIKNNLIP
ncbi:MAG: response regulator transcription factor [bacterium]|nr:response regulator transcription factor [bacterium]